MKITYPNSLFYLFSLFIGICGSFFYLGSTKIQFKAEIDSLVIKMARLAGPIARMTYILDHHHTTW